LAEDILTSNCFVSGYSPRLSAHFSFLASRLFEGGGVGANYSSDLRSATPPVAAPMNLLVTCRPDHPDIEAVRSAAGGAFAEPGTSTQLPLSAEHLTVPDTREGWVGAWSHLIDLSTKSALPGEHQVVLDVSGLRPYGAPLRRFGGKASGPAPFVGAALAIARTLSGAAGRHLSGLETMAIDHEIAASVVAGGARRSARLALMHWQDPEIFDFLVCKSDQMSHWSANISVEIDAGFRTALAAGDQHAGAVFEAVCAGMAKNGEPGLIDTDLASETEPEPLRAVNPCGESFLATDPADGAGEACNLGQVDLDAFGTDIDGATEAVELMARFLYRSTLNSHPDEQARRIEARNRRIGVGVMGVQGWAIAHGYKLSELPVAPELLDKLTELRLVARRAADALADLLGTPRPVKVTAVAPTGTVSNLRGTTPGPHPVFARYFMRRVRYAAHDPAWERLAAEGYEVVDDVYAASTKVVAFPMRDSVLDRHPAELIEQADELSVGQFLDVVAAVQETFCGGTDGQAVSATAQAPEGIAPFELAREIAPRLGRLKGATVFPAISRALPPLEAISPERYEDLVARSGGAAQAGDSNTGCVGGACPIR
jgi:adenosylcobalamin-dependent ribonucleoside-triphosphate reductase